jgi:hypothetical protein
LWRSSRELERRCSARGPSHPGAPDVVGSEPAQRPAAIEYVDSLHIKSNNVPFRLSSYSGSPFSAYNTFLWQCARYEKQNATPNQKLEMANLKGVLRNTALSKAKKKKQIQAMLDRLGKNFFRTSWDHDNRYDDERRIRDVRKAMKFKHGNCEEKSGIASTWLLENAGNELIIWVTTGNAYDHCFTIYGYVGAHLDTDIANWNDEAVIVDGWSSDYYQAKHPYHFNKGVHLPNPFQLLVRKRIHAHIADISIMEVVRFMPPDFSPNFRLAVADQPVHTYRQPGDEEDPPEEEELSEYEAQD